MLKYGFMYVWGKLYKKNLFDKYIVSDEDMGEDIFINIQIFSKIKIDNLAIINSIIYNYNRYGEGMTLPKNSKALVNDIFEHPYIRIGLWMEKYLREENKFEDLKISFMYYMLAYGFYKYLRCVKNIKKRDVLYFYNTYYVPFQEKEKLNILTKTLILTFRNSIFFGKIYAYILDILRMIR